MVRNARSWLLDQIASLKRMQASLWMRSPVLGAMAWLFVQLPVCLYQAGVVIVTSPYVIRKTPTSSFNALARQSQKGVFYDSYQQHLAYYRATVASSIATFVAILIYGIGIFAVAFEVTTFSILA